MTPPTAIVCPAQRPVDFDKLAACVRMIEEFKGRPGKHRERGPYGFTVNAWVEDADGVPFAFATDAFIARRVCLARLTRIAGLLRERRIDVTPRSLGLCWNEGVRGAILHKFNSGDVRSYGDRIEALYYDIGK